ncbi:hypothetical protein PAXRUDRAFT_133604 [Paxillus rubicundulus Ve08.2h10]|uniref:Uncharacterized protein n=1 Tax=Paxillus rubicundulus Ve08.2h10 TaxID=930991 RepID=A0A0D0E8Q9_9AGAM|nr:hypothetical protein PAXRUDRAFT_133604 [Paxillus rubicundulus Ve08.2h10]
MVFWALLCALPSGLQPATLAQESNATCQPRFAWADNSLGQSPCIVAPYLESQCFTNGLCRLNPQAGQYYEAPSGAYANPCECNTVAYSLVSACGACQGAIYLTWPARTVNCNATADSQFSGLPQAPPLGTAAPPWAFLGLGIDDTWNGEASYINATASQSDLPLGT